MKELTKALMDAYSIPVRMKILTDKLLETQQALARVEARQELLKALLEDCKASVAMLQGVAPEPTVSKD